MALFGASFQIGRSALEAYQAAVQITGQNVANVGNPAYARQSGRLAAMVGGPQRGGGSAGVGVRLAALERHVDEALQARLRLASGQRGGAVAVYNTLNYTESLYNELSDQDVSSLLNNFFGSFSQVETAPDDGAARDLVLSAADALAGTLRRIRGGMVQQARDLNDQVAANVAGVNELLAQLAALNVHIASQEAGGVSASSLRDQRDDVLGQLGDQIDIVVREQSNGSINVYLGSEPLVQYNRARNLTVQTVVQDGLELASVRFADNGGSTRITSGQLGGLLEARDEHLVVQLQRLDQLARGLIYEVNRVQSSGAGLHGYASLTSEYAVLDPDAPLNTAAAGVQFPLTNGTFLVQVRDTETGRVRTRQIEVDLDGLNGDDTTLNDLAGQLAGVPGLSASVNAQNRLQIDADAGQEFWFLEDSSAALAALGVGGFFVGTDASDIAVAEPLHSDPALLAASLSEQDLDGRNAARFAALAASTSGSALLGSLSIPDYHDATTGKLAVAAAGAQSDFDAAEAVYQALYAQREAVSGVSLDEETINLTRYQQAYEGAARYLGVVDEMTANVMSLL